MGVVEGFKRLGYIDKIAHKLVGAASSFRMLMLTSVFATYVMSMIVTNDVGLIVMVPFTIQVLHSIGREDKLIKLIVLETLAANLGGMSTPIGNPHNLYTYQLYDMNAGKFVITLLPYMVVSLIALVVIMCIDKNGKDKVVVSVAEEVPEPISKSRKIGLTIGYSILFVLCICVVLEIISCYIPFILEAIFVLIADRKVIKEINYGLLIKFIILFIIVRNLVRLPWIKDNLITLVDGHEFILSVGLSQILSNLPVTVMLASFTTRGYDIMMGANIGGLGTIIASMASVISLEYYGKCENSNMKKYIGVFTLYNVILLALMLIVRFVVAGRL
jgi:Na+/H+ antiporter NhaD/arsenite permease-like protein